MRPGSLTFDAFLQRRAGNLRLARLTHDVAMPKADGLEFGPGDNPVPLPDTMTVTYVDRAVSAGDAPSATPIDYAWTGSGSLTECLGRDGYDFAIAAQVAQYVPNLLGWFRGIHAALRPGGVLNLSLPDRRFMFDATRPQSSLAELVEADLYSYHRPSPRQVFAHSSEVRALEPGAIWAGADPTEAPLLAGPDALERAYAEAYCAWAGWTYVPCHCWVFTPISFLDAMSGAARLKLFPFVLNRLAPAEPGGFEFYVSMRRDREEDLARLRQLQEGAAEYLRGILSRQHRTATLLASS